MSEVFEWVLIVADQADDTGEFPDNQLAQESAQQLREILVFARIPGLE